MARWGKITTMIFCDAYAHRHLNRHHEVGRYYVFVRTAYYIQSGYLSISEFTIFDFFDKVDCLKII